MKKLLFASMVLAGVLAFVGCSKNSEKQTTEEQSDSPREVAVKWANAIADGDAKKAAEYSTERTAGTNAMLIDMCKSSEKGLESFRKLIKEELPVAEETIEGDTAFIDPKGAKKGQGFTLKKIKGEWKIDFDTQKIKEESEKAAREVGRKAICTNNLKQIGMALINYEDSHRCFPKQNGFAGLEELRKECLGETKVFVCPSSGKTAANDGEALSEKNCSYIYFGGLSYGVCSPSLPIVMEMPGNHSNEIAYTRIDSSVQRVYSKEKTAEKIVYAILGKESGFDEWEQKIVDQAKAWDRGER